MIITTDYTAILNDWQNIVKNVNAELNYFPDQVTFWVGVTASVRGGVQMASVWSSAMMVAPYNICTSKFEKYGFDGWTDGCVRNWQDEQVLS